MSRKHWIEELLYREENTTRSETKDQLPSGADIKEEKERWENKAIFTDTKRTFQ